MFEGLRFFLTVLLLASSTNTFSSSVIEPNNTLFAQEQSTMCNSKYSASLASYKITDARIKHFAEQTFQLSDKYCLILGHSSVKDVTSFDTIPDYQMMFERYEQAYNSLQSIDERAAFIDLFLYKVSRSYLTFASVPGPSNENEARVTFSFKNKHMRISHRLFHEKDEALQSLLLYKLNMLSAKNETDTALINLVNYVLNFDEGNKVYRYPDENKLLSREKGPDEEFEEKESFWD